MKKSLRLGDWQFNFESGVGANWLEAKDNAGSDSDENEDEPED